MSFLSILATIAGVLMSLGNLPQAYKIFKRKSAKDISILTYTIFTLGGFVWILYGIEIMDSAVIITNIVGTITLLIVISGWIMYR